MSFSIGSVTLLFIVNVAFIILSLHITAAGVPFARITSDPTNDIKECQGVEYCVKVDLNFENIRKDKYLIFPPYDVDMKRVSAQTLRGLKTIHFKGADSEGGYSAGYASMTYSMGTGRRIIYGSIVQVNGDSFTISTCDGLDNCYLLLKDDSVEEVEANEYEENDDFLRFT